ncbi:tripartite tricarboxylate transporter TctB family protein [Falsigemmobacter faecalis]|uniref:Tripartite tricarboxylate transporter TctB family protein n=1 Tax=Falsigemmobacter faecalis TaxID=2488730 RepID=A0A3P3DV22_9RHOB|nr:tripartite tricarboxylate transporter TctB family protein [Falsigemmobacter faecalis]RRH78113.1 tripartite tricarboxylate transporter TctB family protein [Falsigemmobacter faecalis]
MTDKNNTDILCGLALLAVAGLFGWQVFSLPIGTATRMGPGYFPMVLSALLALLGVIILFKALRSPEPDEAKGPLAWRGMAFILPAPVFFGLTVRGLGFVPALFVTSLIAAFASGRMKVWQAVLLAALVTGFSTLVFSYALGLPFRRFGPWWPF